MWPKQSFDTNCHKNGPLVIDTHETSFNLSFLKSLPHAGLLQSSNSASDPGLPADGSPPGPQVPDLHKQARTLTGHFLSPRESEVFVASVSSGTTLQTAAYQAPPPPMGFSKWGASDGYHCLLPHKAPKQLQFYRFSNYWTHISQTSLQRKLHHISGQSPQSPLFP